MQELLLRDVTVPFTSELAIEVIPSPPDPNFLHFLRAVNLPFCNLSTPLISLLWLGPSYHASIGLYPLTPTIPERTCVPGVQISYDTNATM